MYYTSLFFSYSGQPEKMCVVSIMQKGGLAHTLEVKPLPSYMPHLHFIGGTRKVKKKALPAMQEEKEKKPKPTDAQWE